MDVVGEGLHVGEVRIGLDVAVGVATFLPTVVDIDVGISGVAHAGGHHGVGHVRERWRR